ncbi:MAG: protein phosphatase 2C domain-containing protein, partial [Candidatus Cloacimonetes bacterium]|nr:protein phosphatase 2C domain-containing protein [Candidatus Cloacimonadota bacterium]
MKIEYYAISDIGKKYKHNEDFYTLPKKDNNILNLDTYRLFVLCDGVGGANAGEVASKLSSEWLQRDFNNLQEDKKINNLSDLISNLIKDISIKINKLSLEYSEYKNMMTTLVSALFYQDRLYLHSIGDSRCYLLRNNKLEQLTDDDSLIWSLYKSGEISKD